MRVSEKHGVNPSMELCFWCRKPRGITLMGELPGDVEAPREIITSYEPCDSCKEFFDRGLLLIEAYRSPVHKDQFPMAGDAYPTGAHMVIKREAVFRVFEAHTAEELLKVGMGFVEPEGYQKLLEDAKHAKGD